MFWQGDRQDDPEPRYAAIGYLDDWLHVLVFGETAARPQRCLQI